MDEWFNQDMQLPDGYRQRLESEVLKVQVCAEKIVGIIEEFACSQIELTTGNIEIIIKSNA